MSDPRKLGEEDIKRARAELDGSGSVVPPMDAKTRIEFLDAARQEVEAIVNQFRVRYAVATRLGNRQAMEMIEREVAYHLDSHDAIAAEISQLKAARSEA